MDWWTEGYWRFGEGYGDDRLAQQFLSMDGWTPNPEFPWTYETRDGHHPERLIRGSTLDLFRKTSWDFGFVVATAQDNQAGFARLAREIGAQYVLQVGNTGQMVDWSLDPLALVSSEVPIHGKAVRYHQEIAPEFRWSEPIKGRTIRSFVNCFDSTPCSRIMRTTADQLPGWFFGNHGIDGPNGNIETVRGIAQLMAGSQYGWHDKVQGDGFGHVLHDWAAVGRPLIGHASHYAGKMGEVFWRDGETCIDLDRHSAEETAEIIRSTSPTRHAEMCRAIREEFDRIDWEGETEEIADLLHARVERPVAA